MTGTWIESFLLFSLVFLALVFIYLMSQKEKKVNERLFAAAERGAADKAHPDWEKPWFQRLLWESFRSSKTRSALEWLGVDSFNERLIKSGQYERHMAVNYGVMRIVMLVVVLLIIAFVLSTTNLAQHYPVFAFLYILLLILAALFFPDLLLSTKTRQHQRRLNQALPSFVYLLAAHLKNGYSIDKSLKQSALTIKDYYPTLAREIILTCFQLQAYDNRHRAWENLAERTDISGMREMVDILERNESLGREVYEPLVALANKLQEEEDFRRQTYLERVPILISFIAAFFLVPILLIFVVAVAYFMIRHQLSALPVNI